MVTGEDLALVVELELNLNGSGNNISHYEAHTQNIEVPFTVINK